jgi:Cu/Ag efflux protein CusF
MYTDEIIENKIDMFFGRITNKNGTLAITIPKRQAEFSGIKKGDTIKVWFKKVD